MKIKSNVLIGPAPQPYLVTCSSRNAIFGYRMTSSSSILCFGNVREISFSFCVCSDLSKI